MNHRWWSSPVLCLLFSVILLRNYLLSCAWLISSLFYLYHVTFTIHDYFFPHNLLAVRLKVFFPFLFTTLHPLSIRIICKKQLFQLLVGLIEHLKVREYLTNVFDYFIVVVRCLFFFTLAVWISFTFLTYINKNCLVFVVVSLYRSPIW